VHGSGGYLVKEHPVLIVVGAILLLAAVWLLLRQRR
jgi:LPXTG-motif cell wall-anchored protein